MLILKCLILQVVYTKTISSYLINILLNEGEGPSAGSVVGVDDLPSAERTGESRVFSDDVVRDVAQESGFFLVISRSGTAVTDSVADVGGSGDVVKASASQLGVGFG